MTSPAIILSIIFASFIMLILSFEIIAFGNLVAKTPDGQERRGEKTRLIIEKRMWYSPEHMPKLFVALFLVLHGSGCWWMLSDNSRVVIIGVCCVIAAMVFAGTITAHEVAMYNLMKMNEKELVGSMVA